MEAGLSKVVSAEMYSLPSPAREALTIARKWNQNHF